MGRTFFRLEELAAEWGKTSDDLLCLALDAKLALSVRFDDTRITWANSVPGYTDDYTGWATIPRDAVDLLFMGKAKIGQFTAENGRKFKTGTGGCPGGGFLYHGPGRFELRPIDVQLSDLVVLTEEWARFRAEHPELLTSGGGQEESKTRKWSLDDLTKKVKELREDEKDDDLIAVKLHDTYSASNKLVALALGKKTKRKPDSQFTDDPKNSPANRDKMALEKAGRDAVKRGRKKIKLKGKKEK